MGKYISKIIISALMTIVAIQSVNGQKQLFNPVYTGVTSLSIAPDSRAGAMGDVSKVANLYF